MWRLAYVQSGGHIFGLFFSRSISFLGLSLKQQTREDAGWSGVGRRGRSGGGGAEWEGRPEMAGGRPGRF